MRRRVSQDPSTAVLIKVDEREDDDRHADHDEDRNGRGHARLGAAWATVTPRASWRTSSEELQAPCVRRVEEGHGAGCRAGSTPFRCLHLDQPCTFVRHLTFFFIRLRLLRRLLVRLRYAFNPGRPTLQFHPFEVQVAAAWKSLVLAFWQGDRTPTLGFGD
jgi:hypothetical protein